MREQETERIEGFIASVIYTNEENGYTVLRFDLDDGSQVTVVGCIPMAVPGEGLTAWGSWTRHPTHGEQFKADHVERTLPTGADAIFSYLSSRAVKGIGPATAALIVTRFGDDSLRVLRDHPEKLASLKGISRRKAEESRKAIIFIASMAENRSSGAGMYIAGNGTDMTRTGPSGEMAAI